MYKLAPTGNDDLYKEFVKDELDALLALRARIKAKPYIDQIHKQMSDIRALPSLLETLDNPKQGRTFADKTLRESLLLREKIHNLLKKHGAGLDSAG